MTMEATWVAMMADFENDHKARLSTLQADEYYEVRVIYIKELACLICTYSEIVSRVHQ